MNRRLVTNLLFRTAKIYLVILSMTALMGCSSLMIGHIYSNTTHPYSKDFNNTPVGTKQCIISNDRVREPVTGYGIYAEWDKKTIEEAAKKAGISKIHYAEIKTLRFFRNIYRRRTIIVYGD